MNADNAVQNIAEQPSQKIVSPKTAYLLMLITTIFWGTTFSFSQLAMETIPLFSTTFFRFFFAWIALFIITRHKSARVHFNKAHLRQYLFVGIYFMFGYHVLFFLSLRYTTAINGAMIGATPPILIALFLTVFFGHKLQRFQAIGIAISFIGVILTITNADLNVLFSLQFNLGDIIMIIGMAGNALYQIYCRQRCKDINPFEYIYYGIFICVLVALPFMLNDKPWVYIPNTVWPAWASVIYLGTLCTAFTYMAQQFSIKSIGVESTAIMCNLVPIFGFLFSVFCMGAPFQPIKLLTALVIVTGVVICQRGDQLFKPKTSPPPDRGTRS